MSVVHALDQHLLKGIFQPRPEPFRFHVPVLAGVDVQIGLIAAGHEHVVALVVDQYQLLGQRRPVLIALQLAEQLHLIILALLPVAFSKAIVGQNAAADVGQQVDLRLQIVQRGGHSGNGNLLLNLPIFLSERMDDAAGHHDAAYQQKRRADHQISHKGSAPENFGHGFPSFACPSQTPTEERTKQRGRFVLSACVGMGLPE